MTNGPELTVRADRAAGWQTFVATAIGADHLRAGTPTQDAVDVGRIPPQATAECTVFAVADGHGHSRHFRSDRGSKMAVAAGISAAREWAGSTAPASDDWHQAAGELVADILARWRGDVAADLAADPISGSQRGLIQPGDPPEIPYGSTLLLAVIAGDIAVLAQIGDGEFLLVLPDGRHLQAVPGDDRLTGTQTTSLCQPDALGAFRIRRVNLATSPVFAIFGATDGYGNAQAHDNWQARFAADLVRLAGEHGSGWLGDQLQAWVTLCASAQGSGDDTTAALAVNSGVRLHPADGLPTRQRASRQPEQTLPEQTLPGQTPADQTLRLPPMPADGPHSPPELETRRALPVTPRPARAARTRLWLAGLAVIVVAVVVYLLLHSQTAPSRPAVFTPEPGTSASHSPGPRPSASHAASQAAGNSSKSPKAGQGTGP